MIPRVGAGAGIVWTAVWSASLRTRLCSPSSCVSIVSSVPSYCGSRNCTFLSNTLQVEHTSILSLEKPTRSVSTLQTNLRQRSFSLQCRMFKMTAMIGKSKTEEKIFSRSNPPALEEKQEDHLYKKPVCFPPVPASPSLFSDLDPDMKKLLMEARLSEEDLKNKDVAEVVDCIINQFGGLKAVQKELKKKGTVSQTLPRSAGASISLALQKGPLPPVPSTQNSEQTTDSTTRTGDSQYTPPAAPGPGRLRRSASFKDVGSSAEPQKSDLILKALREVFNQKQMLRQTSREFQN
ncbi:uncharacterized protein LOC116711141 isoform X2 [Xiphophorus hellerii]|uniref:uncharacterized protein LOC116711141 isoform X2 n=1 Tax=Xiphophorus hellerii TaxID=8084 RepID=UPI0013B3B7A3|nr:uncharacterized protein LOC116711141 isoform X2 [Xiphophorus hellerii]